MRVPTIFRLLGLVLILASCETNGTSPRTGITAVIDQTTYTVGSQVSITITNNEDSTVVLGWCNLRLEGLTADNTWKTKTDTTEFCRTLGYVVDPGKQITLPYLLPVDLPEGTYRFRDSVFGFITKHFVVKQS